MTRKEAIKVLKEGGLTLKECEETFDMAIQALKQLTSYEQTINRLVKAITMTDPRPKGHWISHREHCENLGVMPSGLGVYEWCSNCDCGIDVREWHRNNYNYCPNCGADMRGD